MSRTRSRIAPAVVATLSALVLSAGLAAPLSASALVTPVIGQHATGGTITIADDHVLPGGSLRVTGTGFTVADGTTGHAVLAAKLNGSEYEAGAFPWTFSGPSALALDELASAGGSDGFAPIRIEDDGTFDVTFHAPADWAPRGGHYLTFLGGSLSTGTKVLPIQGRNISFAVLGPKQGWATVTSTAHAQDSTTTAKARVSLRNFRAGEDGLGVGQKVGVKLNGTGDILTCIETDADGDADATITLPAKSVVDLPAGANTFNFLAGTACVSGGPVTQAPGKNVTATFNLAKSTITSAQQHPGGTVAVKLEGFMNAAGTTGQKVALKVTGPWNSPDFTCVTTDGFGNGTGTFALPADLPLGTYTLNALAGTNCGEPGDGAPGRSLQATFDVTAAPAVPFTATTAGKISGSAQVGQRLSVSAPTFSKPGAQVRTQWLRNGSPIARATATTYMLTAADLGKRISVRHTAALGGTTLTPITAATAAVKAGVISVRKNVTVKGTARVGKKLSATKASVATPGVTVKRQWLRNGKAIKKATKSSYKLVKADRRKKISLRVTYSKAGHTTLVRTTKKVTVKK